MKAIQKLFSHVTNKSTVHFSFAVGLNLNILFLCICFYLKGLLHCYYTETKESTLYCTTNAAMISFIISVNSCCICMYILFPEQTAESCDEKLETI